MASRAVWTDRAQRAACRRVGRDGVSVAAAAREYGVGWATVMRAVEQEAMARGCEQMVLETHDFQGPAFYRKLGFAIVGAVEGYPRGHQYLTLLKPLGLRRVEA